MFEISVFAVVVVVLFLLYQIKYYRRNKLLAQIPSPPKRFLVHNAFDIAGRDLAEIFKTFETWHDDLGDVFQITLHPFDDGVIFISDVKIAEALSMHQPDRKGSMIYTAISRWIGANGFFLESGIKMKTRLKPLMNVFNPKHFERYLKVLNSQANKTIEIYKTVPEKTCDAFHLARNVALDIGFEVICGYQLNAKKGDNPEYSKAIHRFGELATMATFDPISRNSLLHPLTSLYREEKKVLNVLHEFTRKIIKDRKRELAEGKCDGEFLMLNHYLKTPVDGKLLSDEEVREELDTMLFGLNDTTKTASAFVSYVMAKYPEIQQKVYEEASLLLDDDPEMEITENHLLQMPYIEAVICETMRLYSPVPFVGRKLASEITTGGYTFPKGAEIIISPYLTGRNPKYFEDPLTFNPDRFYNKTPPTGYIPFSIGMRKCPGGKIAFLAMKIIVAKFSLSFKSSLPADQQELTLLSNFTLKTKEGIVFEYENRKTQ